LHKNNIHLHNLDALDLVKKIENKTKSKNLIFYFDPPYFLKGQSLYMNSYEPSNHKEVSEKIKKIKNARWIVSYDDVLQINSLYNDKHIKKIHYFLNYSAYKQKKGRAKISM
jgi:DNA adenine methylase